jgi:hypothetical protein
MPSCHGEQHAHRHQVAPSAAMSDLLGAAQAGGRCARCCPWRAGGIDLRPAMPPPERAAGSPRRAGECRCRSGRAAQLDVKFQGSTWQRTVFSVLSR